MSVLLYFPNRWRERRSYRAKSKLKSETHYYNLLEELGVLEVSPRKLLPQILSPIRSNPKGVKSYPSEDMC